MAKVEVMAHRNFRRISCVCRDMGADHPRQDADTVCRRTPVGVCRLLPGNYIDMVNCDDSAHDACWKVLRRKQTQRGITECEPEGGRYRPVFAQSAGIICQFCTLELRIESLPPGQRLWDTEFYAHLFGQLLLQSPL